MTARDVEVVVVGGSAGALDALLGILPALPAGFRVPVVLVLHVRPSGPSHLPEALGAHCALAVKEVEDKEPLAPGALYVAPPNYHLLVERRRYFSLSVDEPVRFSRPSIDVLFESAADAYGPAVAAVVLSGANDDGARGLARVKAAGGLAIVQAPETAPFRTMPEAALRAARADRVLTPAEIGPFVVSLDRRPPTTEGP